MFSLELLQNLLEKNNFKIIQLYTHNSQVLFIKVFSLPNANTLVIEIPDKFPIKYTDNNLPSTELVEFNCLTTKPTSRRCENVFNLSYNKDIENDSEYLEEMNLDKLLTQYSNIDIDKDKTEYFENHISDGFAHLSRLLYCVKNTVYKLCITNDTSVMSINMDNKINCYGIKRCNPKSSYMENKEIFLVLNLEKFYEKVANIHSDTRNLYLRLYNVLDSVHSQAVNSIISKIKTNNNISEKLKTITRKKRQLELCVTNLETTIHDINKNIRTHTDLLEQKKLISTNSFVNENNNTFQTEKIKNNILILENKKKTAVSMLNDLKKEYNTFVFDVDDAVFSNLELFEKISHNFQTIIDRLT